MNKNTKYNSILFLTTLCLGLVVGNPLSVSLSNLTSEKELIEEFIADSHLEDGSSTLHIDIPVLFVRLLSEIQREISADRVSFPLQTDFRVTGTRRQSYDSVRFRIKSNLPDPVIIHLFQNAFEEQLFPRLLELSDREGAYKNVSAAINGNRTDLVLKVTFEKHDPEQYARLLNKKFSTRKKSARGILRLAYANTLAAHDNNQVLVITRLPRASLDSFINGE